MKIMKNREKTTLIALILCLTFAASLVALPIASAHTPPQTFPTFSYIALTPNPVGVGQSIYVVMWVSPNPPTAMGLAGDIWRDMKLEVTEPNGNVKTVGTFNSDPTGSTYSVFTPDQVGTYTFKLTYPGQVISLSGPNGIPSVPSDLKSRGTDVYIGDTFTGSSATESLVVQQQKIVAIPDTPLPTGYWTRPIYGQNSAWASMASNWLSGSQIGGTINLWQSGIGPNSPHILWTKAIETGGIVGGTTGISAYSYAIADVGFYSGGAYEGRFTNAMIINGKLFYTDPLGHSLNGGGYTAVDLKTGQLAWHSDNLAITQGNTSTGAPNTILVPTFGQLYNYESQNQHGVVGGILWAVTGTTWSAYDSFTGKFLYNLTNVPAGTNFYDSTGAIVRYILNYNNVTKTGSIALWNNTKKDMGFELVDPELGAGTNAYQWRPNGKSVNMAKAYSWNVTFSADLTGLSAPSILRAVPGDIILGASTGFSARFGTPDPYTIWAFSDKPATRGQLLWVKNYSAPAGGVSRTFGTGNPIDLINRVFFMQDTETFAWSAYSLDTGNLVWGPVTGATRAFSYYGSGRGGGQTGFAAYGNLYAQGYGGELCAFSGKDGTLLWKFDKTNSGIETIWGNYPIFVAAIADGKVYAFNNEHSPNYPLYKGEKIYCIDAYTGFLQYSMLSFAGQTGGAGDETGILADGVLCYYNYYDNSIYAVGQGLSATTVSATPGIGNAVTIQGTVTDQSPGQTCIGIPAAGTPAISDDSMSAWMEYLYMQQPKPTNAQGVTVTLQATDPSGNTATIGTTSSDINGHYSISWTPTTQGVYKITSTFSGSKAYFASMGETSIAVGTPTTTNAPTNTTNAISPEIFYAVSAILAILLIIILVLLVMKKK